MSGPKTATGWRVRALVVLTLCAMAAALTLPVTAQTQGRDRNDDAPVVEAARQVTAGTNPVRLFSTPALAVHPDDPSTVAMLAGDARNGGCGLHVSRDGGLSWSQTVDTVMPDDLPHCLQRNFGPAYGLAFAPDGTLHMGMSGSSPADGHPNGPIDALAARTSDLGDTHDTVTVLGSDSFTLTAEDGEEFDGYTQYRMSTIAVDPTDPDKVYRGFHRRIDGVSPEEISYGDRPQRALLSVSEDGGDTWSDEPIDVMQNFEGDPEHVFTSGYITLAVGPDGTAYGFVRGDPPQPDDDSEPAQPFYMVKSTDGGETWTVDEIHEGAPDINRPTPAVDPESGDLYLAWDERGEDGDSPSNVYVMASQDSGETWTEPVQLTDGPDAQEFNQYFPGISVAPNGRVDVAWYDFRNDLSPPEEGGSMGSAEGERYWDVYARSSTDGGDTWSDPYRVTDRSIDGEVGATFNNQDIRGPIGVASTPTHAYYAWADTRAGSGEFDAQDAYFTRARFTDSGSAAAGAPTPAGPPALWSAAGAAGALVLAGLVLLLGTRLARPTRGEAALSR